MIQKLQGIKIIPRGNNNRFTSQNWPNSYAFGGWIYNARTTVGYSSEPTEISLSIVLETNTYDQSAAKFDIQETDLHCDAGNGGLDNETWFDIELEGVTFKNFLLYEYNFSIEVNEKILNVKFKDYSIILDKIYVGLYKKQGYNQNYIKTASCKIEIPIRCQDCEYTGAALIGTGETTRDIGFASYAKANETYIDNFQNFYYGGGNVFDAWNNLINKTSLNLYPQEGFDLNGGYLIIGTESATEERCNSAPDINYSFIELLASLRGAGISFDGVFPKDETSSDYIYRNNHIGTLREVLQNWCSDLGFDFYCSGRSFIGIDLKKPIDISEISKMADPTSKLGKNFVIGGESAILSFNSSSSLQNTFKQAIVIENSYPITEVNHNKNTKRYVGITPLHPISLNEISKEPVNDSNIYGQNFTRFKYEIPYFDDDAGIKGYYTTFTRLDNRSYKDIDTAIALTKYNSTLRDLFVAQRALRNFKNVTYVLPSVGGVRNDLCGPVGVYTSYNGYIQVNDDKDFLGNTIPPDEFEPAYCLPALQSPYCLANFNALGVFPILEITNQQLKADIISEFFTNAEKDGVANLNSDARYFHVFIGYYYEEIKNSIIEWERAASDSMYRYGIVTKGTLTQDPFVPSDSLQDVSPTAGFYGKNGLSYTRIKNNFNPTTEKYKSIKKSPYADVILYSGLVKSASTGIYEEGNPNFPNIVPPGFSEYPGRIPTGLWVSTLENPWGTTEDGFNRSLSFNFNDECASKYSIDQTLDQIITDSDRHAQDWKLEYFLPIISPDLSRISEIFQGDLYNISNVLDGVLVNYIDLKFTQKKDCKKLHVIIIPDTTTHPNLQLEFTPKGINKINSQNLELYKQKVFEAEYNKKITETPSICSLSLIDEMCRNILSGGTGYNFNGGRQRFQSSNGNSKFTPTPQQVGCAILEDKNNYFLDGFAPSLLYSANSRSLDIKIYKNPDPFIIGPSLDENGDYYYADLIEGFLDIQSKTATLEIVYPIQSFRSGIANYSGILSTQIDTTSRLPALNQVYGEPISVKNNNVSSMKIINKVAESYLNPQLDPISNKAMSYLTVITGGGDANIITTPEQYYNFVKNLNNYNLDSPMKNIQLTLAGPPSKFGDFKDYISPSNGLNQMELAITDNGVKTSLVFADRPKKLPQQESLMNKIGPRIKGTYK